jgi:hypothetical protein
MLTPDVAEAIEQIKATFDGHPVTVREDGDGGAYVTVDGIDPGSVYSQSETWVGFCITFQYPDADVYPHFVRNDLSRADGRELGEGMTRNATFDSRSAVQVSRRSNHRNPAFDTAAIKLLKVIEWLRNRP